MLSCMLTAAMLFGMAPGVMEADTSAKGYNKPNPSYSFTTME